MGSDASHMHDQALGLSAHGRILLQPELRVDLNVNAFNSIHSLAAASSQPSHKLFEQTTNV